MFQILIFIVFGLVAAALFINFYFRIKVFKTYRYLVQNRVNFSPKCIMNQQMLDEEVLPQYPDHANKIQEFCDHIRYSVKMASVLIVLITIFGAILMYFRDA